MKRLLLILALTCCAAFPVLFLSRIVQSTSPPNLILITIDTLRADHVSALNPDSRALTPALDALAREGVLFLDASTTNPLTTPAHASLMTGRWPPAHGVRDFTGSLLPETAETLAETLSAAGYACAAFVSAAVLDHQTGIGQGFEIFDDGFKGFLGADARVAERAGAETLKAVREWLAGGHQKPFFLWIHLYEPHDPYTPPPPFLSQYAGDPYSGEIAYVDSLLGDFNQFLKDKGLYRNSVLSVLSDHGEGLGEHGESRHGFFVYQSTMQIPWIIKPVNAESAGRRISDAVSIVDVFPTLLHMLGVEKRHWPGSMQGKSRYASILGRSSSREDLLYMESETPLNQFGWSDLRAVRSGRLKFIQAPRPELYNLDQDPGELHNLYAAQQSLGNRLRAELAHLSSRFEDLPAQSVEVDLELQERLRSLGYVGVQTPRASSAVSEDRPDPKDKIQVYEQMQRGVEAARQRNWKTAVAELSAAALADPDSPSIAASLALALRDSGQTEGARTWFEKAVSLAPDDLLLRSEYAQFLLGAGQVEAARGQLEAILERDAHHFLALFNLGTLLGQQSRFTEAAVYFSRALEVREDAGVLRSLALTEMYSDKWLQAEAHLLRALQVKPDDRQLHRQLAEVYQKLGQIEKAGHHARLAGRP